ncbi:hypothetical protein FPV67DRAFT_616175, partial [Lyophyllum atratum]
MAIKGREQLRFLNLTEMSSANEKPAKLPFTDSFYTLKGADLAFYQDQTGIADEAKLKKHIVSVAEKAYDDYGYSCIRRFSFTKLRLSGLPMYPQVLKLGRQRNDAVFLDIGCGFGNVVREIVADGWPVRNVVASDLRQGFWGYGHELFRSTPDSFPASFVAGDVFDPDFVASHEPFCDPEELQPLAHDLRSLTSLTPLQGQVSAIHASLFFQIFDEAQQLEVARRLATLLSPAPGSMIFGLHNSRPTTGLRTEGVSIPGWYMFCHSPETWRALWDGGVFKKGTVNVDCALRKIGRKDLLANPGAEFYEMWWSVTRL